MRGIYSFVLIQYSELGGSEGVVDPLPRVARVSAAPAALLPLPVRLPVHLHLHPRLSHDLSANVLPVRRPASVHTVKRSASLEEKGGRGASVYMASQTSYGSRPAAGGAQPLHNQRRRIISVRQTDDVEISRKRENSLRLVRGWALTCGGRPAPAAGQRSRTGSPAHTPPGSACPRCPPTSAKSAPQVSEPRDCASCAKAEHSQAKGRGTGRGRGSRSGR